MPDVLAGIALGSNEGDREVELDTAIAFLRMLATDHEVRESPRFETQPVDCTPGSPPFLNSVAELVIDTVYLPPLNFYGCLEEFELERGRMPFRDTNSPRPIDLDIIYYGTEQFDAMGLIIPHPRAHLRRFVLEPLSHLRPELVLPGQKKTIQQLLKKLTPAKRKPRSKKK